MLYLFPLKYIVLAFGMMGIFFFIFIRTFFPDFELIETIFRAFSMLSIVSILLSFFWRRIWRISRLNKIYPDLTGTWNFTLQWQDMKNNKTGEVTGESIIKCGLMKITIESDTKAGSQSSLLCCCPRINEGGRKELLYIYDNKRKQIPDSKSKNQYGSAILTVCKSGRKMEGDYWTNKQTLGRIELKKVT